jgi:predicted ATPase
MRIKAISAKGIEPIKAFHVENLSDVVVIAGPNGVGKSRLLNWLLTFFQNLPSDPNNWVQVEATSPKEIAEWGKTLLDTRESQDVIKLRGTMQKKRRRSAYESSLLNFESDRTITQVKPYTFSWDYSDPYLEEQGWNYGFTRLTGRFEDTVHTIFRKVRSRREAISLRVDELIRERRIATQPQYGQVSGEQAIISVDINKFPDPIVVFKDAFSQLLAPKKLVDPDPKKQQLFYEYERKEYQLNSLSSGEREVVNVVFDFLLRNPSDCIVVFDEPELHLHPELSYRLIQTL